jgi:cell division septation protein DedD
LGAAVIVALAILFVPMFIPSKSPSTNTSDQSVSLTIPPAPDGNLQTKTMSLSGQPAGAASSVAPATTVAPNGNGLATVNIAANRPQNPATASAPAIPTPVQPAQSTQPAMPTPTPAAKANVVSNTPAIAPPPTSPTLPPATAARGIYAVNLSAYAPDGANRLMQRVRALGYPVHGEPIQRAGKSLTLVSAGPFETRAAAETARLKITQAIPGAPARLEAGASTPQGDVPAIAGPTRAGAWAVQVAAMGSQSEALALRDKLRANGFDGFVDSVNAGGRQLWRVRAGPQTQRSDAISLRDQIKAKLGLDGNVVSAN